MSDMIAAAVEALDTKAKASGLSETVTFNIEGEGAVVIDGTGARASDDAADLTVTADSETFQGIMDGIGCVGKFAGQFRNPSANQKLKLFIYNPVREGVFPSPRFHLFD